MADILANAAEISVDFIIRIAQNANPQFVQIPISLFIHTVSGFFKVLGTIQFDYDFCGSDIKIYDMRSNRFLPVCLDPSRFQKIIP